MKTTSRKIRSLFMIVMFALISLTGYSQVSTLAGQTAGTATLALIKKTNDTLAQSARVHTNTLTNISNSLTIISTTLNIVKQKGDSILQNQRVHTSTLTLVKQKGDTALQNQRVHTSTLTLIKQKGDTTLQNQRVHTSTLTLIKQKGDTTNQSLRLINTSIATNSVVGHYGKISNGAAIVMSVAGAYATGEYMGTSTTPKSFTNCVRSSANTATIKSITISDKITDSNVAMELWLFSATFTAPTDNSAWTIGDDDNLNVLGIVPIPTTGWYASGANQIFFIGTLNIKIKPAATSVFYALVARGTTPAFTSGDLMINLGIDQD